LCCLIILYIIWESHPLKSFCRAMGEVNIQQVKPDRVQTYLAGTGPVTRFWELKHNILDAFYRFAIARGYVGSTPLPRTFPKPLQPFVPYVHSHEGLKRLLSAVIANDNPRSTIDPTTFRLVLLMLYGA